MQVGSKLLGLCNIVGAVFVLHVDQVQREQFRAACNRILNLHVWTLNPKPSTALVWSIHLWAYMGGGGSPKSGSYGQAKRLRKLKRISS